MGDLLGELLGDLLVDLSDDLVDDLVDDLMDDQSSIPYRSSHICTTTVGQPAQCDMQVTQRLARRSPGTGFVPAPLP
jgi:hypothetical protein